IFLSGMDLFIQDNFFNLPWQVAFVYDPLGKDEGMFIWRHGKPEREPFLIQDVELKDGAQAGDSSQEDALLPLPQFPRHNRISRGVWAIGALGLLLSAIAAYYVLSGQSGESTGNPAPPGAQVTRGR